MDCPRKASILVHHFDLNTGAEDFTPEQDVEEVRQIEKQIKRRFAIGTQVNVERFAWCKDNE